MRIAFIFDALLYGGIERVGISYLNFLEEDGHDVDVFILNPKDVEGIIEEIPSRFKIHKRKVSQYICPARYWYIAKRFWWGKYIFPFAFTLIYIILQIYGLWFRKFGKYDLAISMAGHMNDLAVNGYNLIRSKKKIAWLHGCLEEYMVISPGNERMYSKIKNLVCLSNNGDNTCFNFNKHLRKNLHLKKIYNPCFIQSREIDESKVNDIKLKYGRFILMIGRMDDPKNPLGVVRALEYIKTTYGKCYHMLFVGDGSKLNEYKAYVAKTEIRDYIHFVGNDMNPQNYYKAASLFAFSSYSEGMPTVIIEAMTFGVPIVTSDTSVREILEDGKDGLISSIDDDMRLGDDIYKMMSSEDIWKEYSKRSLNRADAFSPATIKTQFNQFIENLW
jgi:glycosyltransferase involved in cell wall biosynthesis